MPSVRKKPCVVFTFGSTTEAILMERTAHEWKYRGRMIPLPTEIDSSCGLAWCAPVKDKEGLKRMTERTKIKVEGIYELEL